MTEQPPPPPPPPPGENPYGFGAPWHDQQYPQQNPQQYPPQYGAYYSYTPPEHPDANTALIVGLVSLIGGFFCLLPILASPWAWVSGHKARKEIAASQGRYGGEGKATAGMVLGIIGTVILILGVLGLIALIVVLAVDAKSISDSGAVV